MLRLRALRMMGRRFLCIEIASLLWWGIGAQAEAPSTRVSYQFLSESGSTGLSNISGVNTSNSRSFHVDLSSGTSLKRARVRAYFERAWNDYSRVILTDRQGKTLLLSDRFQGAEDTVSVGVDLLFPALTISVDGFDSVSQGPFPTRGAKLNIQQDIYATGSRFTAEFSVTEQQQPENFYVDPATLRPSQHTDRILEERALLRWEQVLGERWKMRSQASLAHRPLDRPNRINIDERLAYAPWDILAFHLLAGAATELRSQPLKNDRGYLRAYWWQAQAWSEPWENLQMGAGLGTVLETETARGRIPQQVVGTDVANLLARYRSGKMELGLDSQIQFSNTNYRAYQVAGNIIWEI